MIDLAVLFAQDLRTIAQEEVKQGFKIDGQMNFDSGWEWSVRSLLAREYRTPSA